MIKETGPVAEMESPSAADIIDDWANYYITIDNRQWKVISVSTADQNSFVKLGQIVKPGYPMDFKTVSLEELEALKQSREPIKK